MLDLLIQGAPLFFTWQAVLLTAAGIVAGLFIGVLPGLGPLMGIVLMLPVAFHLPPIPAMGMLIAIYVGGSAGGSISAILLRIPGTPLAAATLFDGYPMAQKGRSQDAIGLSIIASSLGGLLAGCVLLFFSPLLAAFALRFGPPEYAAMALFGLLTIAIVSGCRSSLRRWAGCSPVACCCFSLPFLRRSRCASARRNMRRWRSSGF